MAIKQSNSFVQLLWHLLLIFTVYFFGTKQNIFGNKECVRFKLIMLVVYEVSVDMIERVVTGAYLSPHVHKTFASLNPQVYKIFACLN